MNRLCEPIFPSLCRLRWPSARFGAISAVRNYSTASQLSGQRVRRERCEIRTLRAETLLSIGQPILDLSHKTYPVFRISDEVLPKSFDGPNNSTIRLLTGTGTQAFPAGTIGVFYFHHVRGDNSLSQIRFRLCNALDQFMYGEDLRGLDGSPRNLTLKAMARAPHSYHPALALLQKEFPIEPRNIDSSHHCHRVISTLDPQKIPSSGQSVMDFSGLVAAKVHNGESGADSLTDLYYKKIGCGEGFTALAYPPGTIGVFYYKQSLTAPTQLGELRFRLCHNVQEFAQGQDLCSPSGNPWCVSSLSIYTGKTYQALQKLLNKEGLLAASLLPGTPNPWRGQAVMPLRVLSDPFMVDLSKCWIRFVIMNDTCTTASRVNLQNKFRNNTNLANPLFSGRAVVRLEEYPRVLPNDEPVGPLVAMRFLEMLTPIQRLSDDDHMQFPQVGELLLHRRKKTNNYSPWGYNPRGDRRLWVDWIARSRAWNGYE